MWSRNSIFLLYRQSYSNGQPISLKSICKRCEFYGNRCNTALFNICYILIFFTHVFFQERRYKKKDKYCKCYYVPVMLWTVKEKIAGGKKLIGMMIAPTQTGIGAQQRSALNSLTQMRASSFRSIRIRTNRSRFSIFDSYVGCVMKI